MSTNHKQRKNNELRSEDSPEQGSKRGKDFVSANVNDGFVFLENLAR